MTTSLCSHHFRPRMLRTVSKRVAPWGRLSRNGNVPAPRPPGTPPRYCGRSHRSPAPENPSPSDPSGGRGVAGAVAWPAVLEPRIRTVSIVGSRSESVYPTLVGYTPRRSPIWPTCPRDLLGSSVRFRCFLYWPIALREEHSATGGLNAPTAAREPSEGTSNAASARARAQSVGGERPAPSPDRAHGTGPASGDPRRPAGLLAALAPLGHAAVGDSVA